MYPHFGFQQSILVIDDLRKSQALIQNGLLTYPAQFEFCQSDYDKALSKVREHRPDLMVVSLEFEKGSSLEFARQIRQHWVQIPSVFMTEPHLNEIQKSILQMGGFEVVERPSDSAEMLIQKMDTLVRNYRKAFRDDRGSKLR